MKFSQLYKSLSVVESVSIKFRICYENLMENVFELNFPRYLTLRFDLNSQK
jgi:hypothetical protein